MTESSRQYDFLLDDELTDGDLAAGWQSDRMTDDDRALVRITLLQLGRALASLAGTRDVRLPAAGTRANEWIASSVNWETLEGDSHVEQLLGGVATVCRGAASHIEVLVDSVLRGRATVAVGTLTRAIIESLGRANYLLSATDERDLLSKHVALVRSEMKYAAHSVLIVKGRGRLDPERYLSDLQSMIERIGGQVLKAPSYTALATAVLEEAAPGNGSRQRYSQMSGVAHGELPALQMFLTPDEGLVLPRALLIEPVHMISATGILVGDKLRDTVMLPQSLAAQRWNAARDRVLAAALSFS